MCFTSYLLVSLGWRGLFHISSIVPPLVVFLYCWLKYGVDKDEDSVKTKCQLFSNSWKLSSFFQLIQLYPTWCLFCFQYPNLQLRKTVIWRKIGKARILHRLIIWSLHRLINDHLINTRNWSSIRELIILQLFWKLQSLHFWEMMFSPYHSSSY